MGKRRSLEEKLAALARVEAGENPRSLAEEIGSSFGQIYRWRRAYLARGEAGLGRGALKAALTGAAAPLVPTARRPGVESDAERIARLERKIAQQALELDFFETALRHVEGSSRPGSGPGLTASTPASGRRRGGKAG
ncbi:helix-turn-helix domain-containing protein [Oleisolibacter albus]|uniref:helix-turn-helix domain-containing protein n=1 Tax=Oleisolibacter albus TaxID=2171757 RepID=UPI000DF285ED|nr:helix-turn-helix domain-containing protein [Oleisolibacter albus]